MSLEITPKTYLKDIINKYPQVKQFFKSYGLNCLTCKGIKREIIREACHMHGIKVDKFIEDLKSFIKKLEENE